jgi:hypothetical protein
LPQNGGKFRRFCIKTIPEAAGFLNSSIKFYGFKSLSAQGGWSRICVCKFARCAAQGIVAEIPQDLHKQIRGIEAESPVFLPSFVGKKMRSNSDF